MHKKTEVALGNFSFLDLGAGFVDRNSLTPFSDPFKFDVTSDGGKDGIVAAELRIDARFDLGAPLTVKDASRRDVLPVTDLGTEPPTDRIPAVTGATDTFFRSETL